MASLLHDLRGGPDIPVVDAGDHPQQDGQAFHVRIPPLASTSQWNSTMERTTLPPPCGKGRVEAQLPLGVGAVPPALDLPSLGEAVEFAASAGATGVVLSGCLGEADLERLGAMLAVAEAEHERRDGSLTIVAIADNPAGILALPSLRPTPRLAALACDPARLAATLGCEDTAAAIVTARAMTILAASACGVPAVLVADAITPALCREAGGEGFGALLACADP